MIGFILVGAVRIVLLIGLLLPIEQVQCPADGQDIKIPVNRGSGLLLSGHCGERRGDKIAALLGVLLPRQLLGSDGIDAPLR